MSHKRIGKPKVRGPGLIATLCCCVLLNGCLIVPVGLRDKEPFGDEETGQIVAGETPSIELATSFGQPAHTYADGRWALYVEERRMAKWCVASPYSTPEVPAEFGCERSPSVWYALLISTDENGIVDSHIVLTDRDPCTPDATVCLEGPLQNANLRVREELYAPDPDQD